jgi:hypothetical protein
MIGEILRNSARNWQQTIWREWRHCTDLEYGQHLFELVADDQIGWGSRCSLLVLGAVSGLSLGLVIGAPLTFRWSILQQLAWAGLAIGLARGYVVGRQLSWQAWIHRLESNTPTSSPGRLLGGAALLGLCGFFVFGPLFWLIMAGLFWAMGGLITWLNSGLEDRAAFNPDDRQWWFWWRGRPNLFDVQAALQEACSSSDAAHEIWATPLRRLAEAQPQQAAVDEYIAALVSQDWLERFVARYRLVGLGRAAVGPLQALADDEESPLYATVQWLLYNIEQVTVTNAQPQ